MHRQPRTLSFGIAAVCLSFQIAATAASGDAKERFDLPAEPLDKALRDFAIQAKRNISYQPSLVAGRQAPAINGEYAPADVLVILLTGTRLKAVMVDDDTVEVVEQATTTARGSDSAIGADQRNSEKIVHVAYAGASAGVLSQGSVDAESVIPSSADVGPSDQKDLQEITVTGSHIRGVPSASPVIEIGRDEIERSGYTSISDLMLSLPQNFGGGYNPGTAVGNSAINGRFIDNPTGASVPNLRGLGPGSTLTLIDGHRMASGLSEGGADISSIPLDAIERIEVVTDSASSIYGSDAVAGVVNVILKRNYDGAKTGISYGLATEGGATLKRASQLLGTTWDSGSITVAYEHTQQALVDARDRAFTSSSLDPYTLLPQTRSNTVTVSATQDISAQASAFLDGLVVARDANSFYSYGGGIAPFDSPATLRKYAVATGVDVNLWNDWKLSAFGNAAEDATVTNGGNLGGASFPASDERALGSLRDIEINANGRALTLPSGPVRLAVGAGYRREGFTDAGGTTGGPYTSREGGGRNIRYAFGEVSIPIVARSQEPGLNSLDLILSARDERYSDFGSKTVPKVGLVYVPMTSVKLRATWGQAFKAPSLSDIDSGQQLTIFEFPNPASATGTTTSILRIGGNAGLTPETADAWSVGFDYLPPESETISLSGTLFDIRYTNRISQLANPFAALTDPSNAFFVTRSPSPAAVQSLYNSVPADSIFNDSGVPYSAASIGAIVDYRLLNVTSQTARGADLTASYKLGSNYNKAVFFANVAYLDLTEQETPQSVGQSLSGLSFYPAKFRSRGGASWKPGSWALTGTVNYLGRETNTQVEPIQRVGSWTTVDVSLTYAPVISGKLSGLHFSLAAINILDRDPPRVLIPQNFNGANLNYDSSNASPLGRFVSLSVSKQW